MLLLLLPFRKQIAGAVIGITILLVVGHKTGFMQERLGIDLAPVMYELRDWAWSTFKDKMRGVWEWLGNQWDRIRIGGPDPVPETVVPSS